MSSRIIIEVVEEERFGSMCGSVTVKTTEEGKDNQYSQTPWMIGEWKKLAEDISNKLNAEYPQVPQTRIGF